MLSVIMWKYGLVPITLVLLLIGVVCWQSRLHWLSGLSTLCAPLLVFALGAFPTPPVSPVGWAANVARVVYFRRELRSSYLQAKSHGESVAVGQLPLDGFGSLTSGLAYDPSREIERPADKRSDAWMLGPGRTELGLGNLEVHHIFGSYYFWFHS
jgi:hypothetical protein